MAFFNRFGIHPLQGPINNPRPDLPATIGYETGTGIRGLPVTQLGLTFQPRGNVANPEMSLAPHPPALDIVIRYTDRYGADQEIPLHVPLSGATATAPIGQSTASPAHRFRLPGLGRSRKDE